MEVVLTSSVNALGFKLYSDRMSDSDGVPFEAVESSASGEPRVRLFVRDPQYYDVALGGYPALHLTVDQVQELMGS